MAKFYYISYPPAQKRAYTNVLSDKAEEDLNFFILKVTTTPADKDQTFAVTRHRMPFWVSTNTPGTGMDAPTWRGANDRF